MKLDKEERLISYAKKLHLSNLKNNFNDLLEKASLESPSYLDFLDTILSGEIECRKNTAFQKRLRQACFPYLKRLEDFELNRVEGINRLALNQLSECQWIRQKFNLLLIGPPGTGKTHLSIGLGIAAVKLGFNVSFVTVKDLIHLLREEDLNVRNRARLDRIKKADLLIADEMGYYPLNSVESGLFFHLLNELHGKTSILITSNKSFINWPEFFEDEYMVTASLDRILYKCDIIQIHGDSYRMENRKSFLSGQ